MKTLASLLLLLIGLTAFAQPFPPILRNRFTTNSDSAAVAAGNAQWIATLNGRGEGTTLSNSTESGTVTIGGSAPVTYVGSTVAWLKFSNSVVSAAVVPQIELTSINPIGRLGAITLWHSNAFSYFLGGFSNSFMIGKGGNHITPTHIIFRETNQWLHFPSNVIVEAGSVGIGTNNPQSKLHVVGSIISDGTGASASLTLGGLTSGSQIFTVPDVAPPFTNKFSPHTVTDNQALIWDTGCLCWTNGTVSGSISGADTRVLFFDGANNPAGDAGMTYNKTTDSLTVAGVVSAGTVSSDIITQDTGTGTATFGTTTIGGSALFFNVTAETNTGVYVPVAGNTSTNIDFGVRDVHTNFLAVGVTSVAYILSNVHANASKILAIVNRTNDVTVGWAGAINWYGDPLSTAPSNTTVFVGFNTFDGKTNAWVLAGQRAFNQTNDFVLNAYNTNSSARSALIYATIAMTNILAGDVSRIGLYVDQDGDGVWEKTGTEARLNGVALSAGAEELSFAIMPGGRWIFTNLSAGISPSAVIQANSSQVFRQ